MVIIDRLTKYAQFIVLSHPFTAKGVVQAFLDHVLKLHRLPETITSERDTTFTINFCQELFKL